MSILVENSLAMIPLVEIPALVKHYSSHFESCFSSAEYEYFQRYLSGLIISENKTVSGINKLFILKPRDQSSLNRFLTRGRYDLEQLNNLRLKLLSSYPHSGIKSTKRLRGCLSLDDTLLSHYGEHFDHIANLWNNSTKSFSYGHNLVSLNYSDDQVDYPLYVELWKPYDLEAIEAGLKTLDIGIPSEKLDLKETAPQKWRTYLLTACKRRIKKHPQVAQFYRTKIQIAKDLLKTFFEQHPDDLSVSFDSWYTRPDLCQYIDKQLNRSYVGTLNQTGILQLKEQQEIKWVDFAKMLQEEQLQGKATHFHRTTISYKGAQKTYYCYCKTHRVKKFGRLRLVIRFDREDLKGEPIALIANTLTWRVETICRNWCHRWPVESFYQQGKDRGMDKYQVRDFRAIQRHIAFVIIVYSILQIARKDPELLTKLQLKEDQMNQSLAFWCRLTQGQMLLLLIQWIITATSQGHTWEQIAKPIMKAFA